MDITKGLSIKLDDGNEYIVVSNVTYSGNKYIYIVDINDNANVKVATVISNDENIKIKILDTQELNKEIISLFLRDSKEIGEKFLISNA